ncbi:MAG: hypothetical protein R2843_09800 [Thermomicrobiales bacterium]
MRYKLSLYALLAGLGLMLAFGFDSARAQDADATDDASQSLLGSTVNLVVEPVETT